MLRDKYGIEVNFKLVYPIAIRMPEFFKSRNFFTYFWWKMIDMKLKARKLGMKFVLPPKPDPIKQDIFTGKVSDDQPYIFDICHLLQAAEKEKQIDFALEISSLIFGGGKNWNKDEELIKASSNIGLDFYEMKKRVSGNESKLVEEIKNNQKDQLEVGHHGVPLSVYKNNYFFGQDKFDDLVEELKKDGLSYS
jgi:hypothetical protein|tara:strand:+ start:129 stop:707 length:579 start_codon:yes stop_codon:yes gene_type:complete